MNNLENWFDLQIWFFLQMYYWPNYVIGKQDEWKNWFGSYNICNPYR